MKRREICKTVRKAVRALWPTCAYCGRGYSDQYDAQFSVDHLLPLSKGGTNDPPNLVGCCRCCNRAKGDRSPQEWAADVLAVAVAAGC